jgi:anti-sigma factor RsiW
MNDPGSHPGEKRILAFLDGELGPAEAEEVRDHCQACGPCGRVRDGFLAIGSALNSQGSAEPLRPVWPVVEGRLEEARRSILRPVFGAAAAAAVAFGLFLGLLLGSTGSGAPETESSYLWSSTGSSLTGGSEGTLFGAYAGIGSESGRRGR